MNDGILIGAVIFTAPVWLYFVVRFAAMAWFRSKREQLTKGGDSYDSKKE